MKKDTFAMVAGGVVALMAMLAFAMVAAIRQCEKRSQKMALFFVV